MNSILILEDEDYTRKFIKQLVSESAPAFQILDTSKSSEAIDFAKEYLPDIALLDIELDASEKLNGLDVAKIIHTVSPDTKLVFITGHSQYAMYSFGVHPYDYILKPIDIKKFIETISVLTNEVKKEKTVLRKANKIIIENNNEIIFITPEDILFIEKQKKSLLVYTAENVYCVQQTLNGLEQSLPQYFIRVHRSFIVNKNKIHKIRKTGNRTYQIEFLETDKVAFMSKHRLKELKGKIISS
ncbi:MAG: hypothetical protein PWR27_2378 [Petroclostridium sp.]|jgi:two-component system LytT family response regulator|uniref:LytR/AlgR family response regulator transcription factor n=1 Tax=Petroclostridium xylanilyticum TaxID=1792311 RepID=UPI000B98DBE7|nr:LytTR family DNA-binding domain-containing protein [Petroclostridium xylanilyticum]MBZ4646934.1 two component transcriptional regulator, LytTR family [Clostridia bacterium]MDK2811669.1 hypothetical protein [Petroclostridium sp.]